MKIVAEVMYACKLCAHACLYFSFALYIGLIPVYIRHSVKIVAKVIYACKCMFSGHCARNTREKVLHSRERECG